MWPRYINPNPRKIRKIRMNMIFGSEAISVAIPWNRSRLNSSMDSTTGRHYCIVIRGWPASTASPTLTAISTTSPSRCATTVVFIFIASMTATGSPWETLLPLDTASDSNTPANGLARSSGPAASSAAAAAGGGNRAQPCSPESAYRRAAAEFGCHPGSFPRRSPHIFCHPLKYEIFFPRRYSLPMIAGLMRHRRCRMWVYSLFLRGLCGTLCDAWWA